MDTTKRFVCEANIARFIGQLERSTDDETQHVLRQLLIDEEDRFGRYAALLDITDRHIQQATDRIAQQQQRLDRLMADGRNTAQAEQVLQNMRKVGEFLVDIRKSWAASVDRAAL